METKLVKLYLLFFHRDLNKVNDGIGQKIGMFIMSITLVLVGFILGFVYGWKLTLVIIAISPLIVIAGGIMGKVTTQLKYQIGVYSTFNYHEIMIIKN